MMDSQDKTFVPLHVHSMYSRLIGGDGFCFPRELAQRAKDIGCPAIALTDHGTLAGTAEFYRDCKKIGIKPILGMEAYITPMGHAMSERINYDVRDLRGKPGYRRPNYHLILLARDDLGWANLMELSKQSYAQGYYYKPRIDHETLKEHHEGLVVSAACILGEVANLAWCEDYGRMRETAQWYQDVFGEDYYLEVMYHGLDMERKALAPVRDLARELGIKVIATNDSHYSVKSEYKLHKALMLDKMHKSFADKDVSGSFFGDDEGRQSAVEEDGGDSNPIFETSSELYIKDWDEMVASLAIEGATPEDVGLELSTTLEIADKCNYDLPLIDMNDMSAYYTPVYPVEKDLQYDAFKDSGFEIKQSTIDAIIKELRADGREGDRLEDFLSEHEMLSLRFLMWMCDKGIRENVIPKLEARGKALPMEFWCDNPPKGFEISHTHNSPDELWIREQIENGLTVEDMIQVYQDRVDYEISVVVRKGFIDYFSVVQNYANFTKLSGSVLGPGRGCVTPDTGIVLADGSVRAIADVQPGDVTIDEKGQPTEVLERFEYDVDEELCDLTVFSAGHIRLTPDHKVLVSKAGAGDMESALQQPKWLPAADVAEGDWVFMPVSAANRMRGMEAGSEPYADDSGRVLVVGDMLAMRVMGNQRFDYMGRVYDLKVDTDNEPSYLTESGIIHNSGGGSLLLYLLSITSIDPIPNKLLFFRFLNPDRLGYPDVDLDWSADFRDNRLKPYLREFYGEDYCASVATYMYYWGKAAIKAAARILFPMSESVQIGTVLTEALDDKPKLDLNKELDGSNPQFEALVNSRLEYKQTVDLARMIQGRLSGESIHASAYIVSPRKLTDFVPLSVTKDERARAQKEGTEIKEYLIQLDGNTCAEYGLVKLDLLCVVDLEMMEMTCKTIERIYGCKINLERIPLDDAAIWSMLNEHLVSGIFQLDGSEGMAKVMDQVRPENIENINAIVALYRPGPMDYIPNYVNGKNHPETVTYLDERLEPILKDTYGVCVAEGTKVMTESGCVAVEDVSEGTMVKTETGEFRRCVRLIDNGDRECVEVRTTFGVPLVCTPEHRLLTTRGWVEAGSLRHDDVVRGFDDNGTAAQAQVTDVVPVGVRHVYDLSIDGIHSFVAHNIIAHNCAYQEQSMQITQVIGGFSGGQADHFRKCLSKDTLMWTPDGPYTLEELAAKRRQGENVKVHTMDENECVTRFNVARHVFSNGIRHLVKVRLGDGSSVTCTPDHQFMTELGWMEADKLAGHYVYKDITPRYGTLSESQDKLLLVAAMVTEGFMPERHGSWTFCNKDMSEIEAFVAAYEHQFGETPKVYEPDSHGVVRVLVSRQHMKDLGLHAGKSDQKLLPEWVLRLDEPSRNFIVGKMIDFDGYFTKSVPDDRSEYSQYTIGYSSKNRALCEQMLLLFNCMGVRAVIHAKYNKAYDRDYYSVDMSSSQDVLRIAKAILPASHKAQAMLPDLSADEEQLAKDHLTSPSYSVPNAFWYPRIMSLVENSGYSARELFGMNTPRQDNSDSASLAVLRRFLATAGRNKQLERLSAEDKPAYFESVVSVEDAGEGEVYDFSMNTGCLPQAFANGVLVHNCSAKKHMDQLMLLQDDFVNGAIANDTDPQVAEELWSQLVKFGSYSFNRSHSAAYALIAYRGAFLKAHFPECFFASLCTLKPKAKKTNKVPEYLDEARQMGVTVKPPHVNYSEAGFDVPEKGVIAFGLGGIAGVGSAADYIVKERHEHGPFKDFSDFMTRVPREVGKGALLPLMKFGALDGLGWSRRAMVESIDQVIDFRKKYFASKEQRKNLAVDLFSLGAGEEDASRDEGASILLTPPFDTEYNRREMLEMEKRNFGTYLSGSPEEYRKISRYATEQRMGREYKMAMEAARDTARRSGRSDVPPKPVHVKDLAEYDDYERYNGKPVDFICVVSDPVSKNRPNPRVFQSGKGCSVNIQDWGVLEESRVGFAPRVYKSRLTIFKRLMDEIALPRPGDLLHVVGKVNIDKTGEWPNSVIVDKLEVIPDDRSLLASMSQKELTALQERLERVSASMGDPSSDMYMVPTFEFPTTDQKDAFVASATEGERFKGSGHVLVTVKGDKSSPETLDLRPTSQLVQHAQRFGAAVRKFRLPKAQSAIERMKLMHGGDDGDGDGAAGADAGAGPAAASTAVAGVVGGTSSAS